jgi:Ran GTPase-activating protein (RanGAP) involved in mRNA processing and transport
MELDLNGSTINEGLGEDEEGADTLTPLYNVLCASPSLMHLNLKDCSLGSDGMIRVCKALLVSNATLIFLDVSENELGPTSCNALADLLHANINTLKTFKCEDNELTSIGVERIMAVYTDDNNALEELLLNTNQLGHRAAVALTAAVFPSLHKVHLDDNGFTPRDVECLMDTFRVKLEEMGENLESDADADLVEEEEGEAGEEEEKEASDDELEPLTQFFSTQFFSHQQYI